MKRLELPADWSARAGAGLLVLSGLLIAAGCVALTRFDAVNGRGPVTELLVTFALLFAVYAAAARLAGRAPEGFALAVVIAGAVVFRLLLVPVGLPAEVPLAGKAGLVAADFAAPESAYEPFLLYDSDVWRFLWDGHVAASGRDPYAAPPTHESLDGLAQQPRWDLIRDRVNHPDYRTVYPPGAQVLFRLAHAIAPGSVVAFKLLLILCDLGVVGCLMGALQAVGRRRSAVLLYAWNPLVLKAFAASAHFDVLAVLGLAACAWFLLRGHDAAAGAALAVAVLAKWFPLLAVPFLLRRIGWRHSLPGLAVLCVGCLPLVAGWNGAARGLAAFGGEWEFNGGPFTLLRALLDDRALALVAVVAAVAWIAWALWRTDDGKRLSFVASAGWLMGLALLLSPVVMPWYVTWLLPFALLARQRVWFYFSALSFLAFVVMVDGTQRVLPLVLEYGLVGIVLARLFSASRESPPQAAGGWNPSTA